jgi:hypothetical protein
MAAPKPMDLHPGFARCKAKRQTVPSFVLIAPEIAVKRQRSKNLQPSDIKLIIGVFDGWAGPVSWERVIDAVEARLFFRYTRQALSSHQKIREAFGLCKERQASAAGKSESKPLSPEQRALQERLARREAEILRLKAANDQLHPLIHADSIAQLEAGIFTLPLDTVMPLADYYQVNRKELGS